MRRRKLFIQVMAAAMMLGNISTCNLAYAEEPQDVSETQVSENKLQEVEVQGTQASEPQAPETQTTESKTPENESISEPEKSSESDSENMQTSESGQETENDTEKVTEKAIESNTDSTSETESETAPEAESKNETLDETEGKAVLETSVKQEIFADADQMLSVKYTVTVVNQSDNAKAENVTVKAVLGSELSFFYREGQSSGLNYVENLGQIPDSLDLSEISILNSEQLKPYGSAVIWTDETFVEGEKKEYIFFAHVGDTVTGTENLPAMFFAGGKQVDETRIQWINGELLSQQKGSEVVTELPAEYPIQASWEGDTLSIGDTVTLTALTEEMAPVFWESLGEDGGWSVVSEGKTYSYELTMDNYRMLFRAVSGTADEISAGE